ncbi:MAG: M14 family zinc carboxypeptidase, partial [Xanthomonadales bacterium]|nr:M14 family zinc carboxypeptidase [Xanthomonadales bacterium]
MGRLIACLLLLSLSAGASAQRLAEWTEGPGELGLGYPVPIPVDTALPFNGFRTYSGLFIRHQNFMLTRDLVDGFVVGRTMENREIWAYRLGDSDFVTPTGLPESAVMIQGGVHAREWQSPEVLTGLMEWILLRADDDWVHEYLLDHMNIVMIPVLNVDGFLQTQRYPRSNYLESDPMSDTWPRDGRMRRKNMRSVDQDLFTVADHLLGVDLNRNNAPFWNSGGSSGDRESIVYRGTGPESEPEIRAMISAAELAPASRLRAFTDVHSYAQLIYSIRTDNSRRNAIQSQLLADFAGHQAELPGNKVYPEVSFPLVGSTDEYFAFNFQVPSWTLEVEPSDGTRAGLPGGGADYGGLGSNSHDGFILPADQVRRVRDTLAESFVVVYYHQAGPPSVTALRFIDSATGAVVYDAEWDVVDADTRVLHLDVLQPLEAGRAYRLWVAFDKPMRYRENGLVAPLPGQPRFGNSAVAGLSREGQSLPFARVELRWTNTAGGSPDGYLRYADDTFVQDLVLAEEVVDEADGVVDVTIEIAANDMVGQNNDADPATPVDWGPGHWVGYEDGNGVEGDIGGVDRTLQVPITAIDQPAAFLMQPGNTAAYFDPTHTGEGFL